MGSASEVLRLGIKSQQQTRERDEKGGQGLKQDGIEMGLGIGQAGGREDQEVEAWGTYKGEGSKGRL